MAKIMNKPELETESKLHFCGLRLCFVGLMLLTGCGTPSQDAVKTGQSEPDQGSYINNTLMLKKLAKGLKELHDNDDYPKVEELCKQLSREQCDIQLPKAAPPTERAAELYAQKRRAVLAVGSLYKCDKCTKWHVRVASGFLVSSDGVMITNYHVVDHPDAGALGVLTYDGKICAVTEVLAADKSADIAILQLEGSGFPYISLLARSPVGSKVWVISNPSKQFYTFTEGIISAQVLQNWSGGSTKRISITADFGGGSSGAPVFDERGSVIGMVSATKAVTSSKNCKESYAQMVFRYCVPAELMLDLFSVDMQRCAE